jgi:hypothetical protein
MEDSLKNVRDFDQPAFCKLLECSAAAFWQTLA